jgi:ubiquinone/menaquinone biosynthesis C-methylase UbiE
MRHILEHLNDVIKPWEDYSFSSHTNTWGQKIKSALKQIYLWSQKSFAVRYQPVLMALKDLPDSSKILEVGSGTLGLSRYLRREITGIDINTKGPRFEHMRLVTANAWDLPFEDQSFDVVVSMDMLEHIPPMYREQVVRELLRVSKSKVFLAFPSGEEAEVWEAKARNVYDNVMKRFKNNKTRAKVFAHRNSFLLEHAQYGLPKVQEVSQYIRSSGQKRLSIEVLDNESVLVWYWGVLGHMKYSYGRWLWTTIIFILFFPFLAVVRWGGTYRKIFVIHKGGGDVF